jgi:hypothetical protein
MYVPFFLLSNYDDCLFLCMCSFRGGVNEAPTVQAHKACTDIPSGAGRKKRRSVLMWEILTDFMNGRKQILLGFGMRFEERGAA